MNFKKTFILLFICVSSIAVQAQFLDGTKIPADTTFNVPGVFHQIKNNFPEATPAIDFVPEGVSDYRNIVYATVENTAFGERELHLDLFRPEQEGRFPALIMVHGGGWRAGNKSLQVPMAQMIAAKGFVAVTVEYQLSLEAQYPAAVHNIKSAIRWMRANAEQYGIDTERIAISGCSAGGQLATLVGLTSGVEKFEGEMGNLSQPSNIQAIIDIDGVINFMDPLSLNLNRKPDSPDIQWLGGSFYDKPAIWKDASPAYWANKNSVPILFLNSGYPRFHAGQDELIGMYRNWGIYSEVHKFDILMHPFWLFHPWVDETVDYMVTFLQTQM